MSQDDYLARYLSNEGWFNESKVKGDAFRPRRESRLLKTSITRHDGNDPSDVERRGNAWKNAPGRKNPINFFGWANVESEVVLTIPTLDIQPAPSHADPNHGNIIGWHLDEGQHMIQAEEIARQAQLVLLPDRS